MKNIYLLFATITLAVVLVGCVQTSPQKDTIRIHDSSGYSVKPKDSQTYDPAAAVPDPDPDGTIAMLEKVAREDPRAAYDLSLRLFRGDGIRSDSYKALQWMRDSAERGNVQAAKALGGLYLTGLEEMGADYREAEKWLTIASNEGDKEAQEMLAEAARLRKNEDDFYRWKTEMRPIYYRYWHRSYPYYYKYRKGRWYLY